AALEVLVAGVVIGVGSAPFLHDSQERLDVGVVVGVGADQDVVAAGAAEGVGSGAADQQIPAAAPADRVVARAADQDVVGDAAAGVDGVEGVVAVTTEEQRRHGQAAD